MKPPPPVTKARIGQPGAKRARRRSSVASISPPAAPAIIGSMKRVGIEPRISIPNRRSVPSPWCGDEVEGRGHAHAGDLARDDEPVRQVVLGDGQRRLDLLATERANDPGGRADMDRAGRGHLRADDPGHPLPQVAEVREVGEERLGRSADGRGAFDAFIDRRLGQEEEGVWRCQIDAHELEPLDPVRAPVGLM